MRQKYQVSPYLVNIVLEILASIRIGKAEKKNCCYSCQYYSLWKNPKEITDKVLELIFNFDICG